MTTIRATRAAEPSFYLKGNPLSRHSHSRCNFVIRHCLQLAVLLAAPLALSAQSPCRTTHLTIFDANLAEFLDERTLDLQAGSNYIEWRSLMPQTYVRTVRVTV